MNQSRPLEAEEAWLSVADGSGELERAAEQTVGRGEVAERELEETERLQMADGHAGIIGLLGERESFLGGRAGLVHAPQVGMNERSGVERQRPRARLRGAQRGFETCTRVVVCGFEVAGPAFELAQVEEDGHEQALLLTFGQARK